MSKNPIQTAEDYLAAKVQELEAKLESQQKLNRDNIDRWNRERNEWERERSMMWVFTGAEAQLFLDTEQLPENMADRVQNYLQAYKCRNCDGRLCMGCVFRDWDHECANDCPDCCVHGECVLNG